MYFVYGPRPKFGFHSFGYFMVGSSGLEPPTSRLSGVCSNQLSYEPIFGGDERDRTADPLLARQVLSQLSYTPTLNKRLYSSLFKGKYGLSKLDSAFHSRLEFF